MKISLTRYIVLLTVVATVLACSTKKDKFLNRNFHAMTTKYNVLYNGNIALETGKLELHTSYVDNFWEVLPTERMQITEPIFGQDSVPRNANFRRAEDKAIKAIDKHSMSIGGSEKNPQMDEAYLLLAKARYYDQRFIPALEALNFILYKYPDSDRINELKIWKEKVNIRLENEALAIQSLSKLLREAQFDDQVKADANAVLAQAYYNENKNDSAISCLKRAHQLTKSKEEKARYTFIIGQLFAKENKQDQAHAAFQQVIEMKRKSPRQYVIQAHISQANLSEYSPKDTVAFLKKYKKLLEDRENRPFLDALNHQMALYYEKQDNKNKAITYYNRSLSKRTKDVYTVASNYRNLGEIYFYDAKYALAGKYYDSTLAHLDTKTREFRSIRRKRENLDDVIKYEAIAQANDSILNLVRMSGQERKEFFAAYVAQLKKDEALRQKQQEKAGGSQDYGQTDMPANRMGGISSDEMMPTKSASFSRQAKDASVAATSPGMPPTSPVGSNFYFYNQNLLNQGRTDFRRRWGNRPLRDYWRLANYSDSTMAFEDEEEFDEEGKVIEKSKDFVEPRFTAQFYLSQIPTDPAVIDELQKERNFAYYQLGIIYKDKFKEYYLAQDKLEGLLQSDPEERLILPAMYNLYKVYEILGSDKRIALQSAITSRYPDSRYAQIINNPNSDFAHTDSPEKVYKQMYSLFEQARYKELLEELNILIDQYAAEDIIAKLELLKANAIGNLRGLAAYKNALNYVALTYPNAEEGKEAEDLLNKNIPKLEKQSFGKESASWKLIYKTTAAADLAELHKKLDLFLKDRPEQNLKITFDGYTETENFVVIHNIGSEQEAKNLVTILAEYKDYKIKEPFVVLSTEDYKIIQIKKNYEDYLLHLQPKLEKQ